jgi:hypothetical protein
MKDFVACALHHLAKMAERLRRVCAKGGRDRRHIHAANGLA